MSRVPDYIVEKVHLGLATAAERAQVEADPDARARLAALPTSDAAFFEAHPVDGTVQAIERRARLAAAPHRGRPGAVLWAAPLALVAAAVLFVAVANDEAPVLAVDPVERSTPKGSGPGLHIYRELASGPEHLAAGSVALEGDRVQVEVTRAGGRSGVVLSIDGRGTVTRHWPEKPNGPTKLKSGQHRLDHAYQLDDAPKFERFFLVTSEGATDVTAVMDAAQALAASGHADKGQLQLPEGYEQTSTLVRKVNR